MRFAYLFALFVGSDDLNSDRCRAYGSIINSRDKRQKLTHVAGTYFQENPDSAMWQGKFQSLIDHHKEASQRRNDIAHGLVTGVYNYETSLGIFLCPPHYNALRTQQFHESAPWASKWSSYLDGFQCRTEMRMRTIVTGPAHGGNTAGPLVEMRLVIEKHVAESEELSTESASVSVPFPPPPIDNWDVFKWDYRFTSKDIGEFSEKFGRLTRAVDSYLKMLD